MSDIEKNSVKSQLLKTFKDSPTRDIRIKAATFGFEKALHPDSVIRRRIRTSVLIGTAAEDPRLLKNSLEGMSSAIFDDRTWRNWKSGKLSRPHVLKSYCEQLIDKDWPSRILEKDSLDSPIVLLLFALDTLLIAPKSNMGSLIAKKKIERARWVLNHLESKWVINPRFNQLFLPESWIHPLDLSRITNSKKIDERIDRGIQIESEFSSQSKAVREEKRFEYAAKVVELDNLPFGACKAITTPQYFPNRIEFRLNRDVCSRYEIESPLKFLQYLLRMSIHIQDDSEFPLHTYSIDLLTAATATLIFTIWFDDGISEKLRSGPLSEAVDAVFKTLINGKSDIASHLIHTTAPWGRTEQFPHERIETNLTLIRRAYMIALHGYGITQHSIKEKIRQFNEERRFRFDY